MTTQNKSIELAKEWLESTDSSIQAMVFTLVQQSKKEERERIIKLLSGIDLSDVKAEELIKSLSNTNINK